MKRYLGHGVKLKYNNDIILAGNNKLMDLQKIRYQKIEEARNTCIYC